MPFSLAVIRSQSGPIAVVETDGALYRVDDLVPGLVNQPQRGMLDILEQWEVAEPRLDAAVAAIPKGRAEPLPGLTAADFLAPVLYPSKIVCTGTNYYDHLRNDLRIFDFDKTKNDILFFLKPSHVVVGPGPTVRYPSQSKQLDWEIELVAVIGKRGRRIPLDDAMSFVAGYAVGIDLSARDWQLNPRHLKQFDLMTGKSFDDSSPLGPYIVPARFVDPANLSLKLSVNGETKQDANTGEMIWSVAEQISALSQHMTLEPGDVLYTGTPAGVGLTRKTFLKVGDRIDAEITGLGRLTVDIIPDPDAARAAGL